MTPEFLTLPCKVCGHGDVRLRQRTLSNRSTQYLGQCQHCGRGTQAIAKATALAFAQGRDVPQHSEALRDDYLEAERLAADDRYQPLSQAKAAQPSFWERYEAYLRTEEWQRLREKVFRRAGGHCEGCLDEPATQVHHLSYKHLGNEFLWELVAICDDCHTRCHEQSQYDYLSQA